MQQVIIQASFVKDDGTLFFLLFFILFFQVYLLFFLCRDLDGKIPYQILTGRSLFQ